jgi:hypothetical protein
MVVLRRQPRQLGHCGVLAAAGAVMPCLVCCLLVSEGGVFVAARAFRRPFVG